ncbi:hypothetical protein L1049_007620 [Liquidambar formosana]|uniref:DUF6821 domain-containing protein n=1 Tax=Liquidambar formosana TaxID=63359 RepID=A0AAP0X8K0_LIQFO
MDLEEWEFLPDDGFLDFHEDGGGKKIFHRGDPKSIFNMNHFILPSPTSRKIAEPPPNIKPKVTNQLVPVPIQFDQAIGKDPDDEILKEITKVPIEITVMPSPAAISEKITAPNLGAMEADQDAVSQVFFKKMKENEFVDMKMDSPKSGNRGITHQIDAGTLQFDDKGEGYRGEALENKASPKMKIEKEMANKKNNMDSEIKEEVNWEGNHGGLNIWKWSSTGIGTLCSIGVAAATICILILGSQQKNKQHQQNQKLQFQIYTDDKRIKQVVHHATKLNEAISAVRGVPLSSRAHITFGGYYDGL